MYSRVYQRREKNNKTPPQTNLNSGMLQGRPLPMQLKILSQQSDLKTSLIRAERYGHHLDAIQCAGLTTTAPIQMLSEEEEKKLIPDTNLDTSNKHVLDKLINLTNGLKSFDKNHQQDINPESVKHLTDITNTVKSSKPKDQDKQNKDKEKDKKQNLNEHSTSPTNKFSEYKETEDPSLPHDPEVKRLLNKQTQENLKSSSSGAQKNNQENNQDKSFIAPPPTYNENKSAPSPKVGTRGQYLAKKEAMDMLGNNKEFTATQRAVKTPITNADKSVNSKAEDSKHQVKLKNSAELIRDQVINEDRQVKENVREKLNLDPAIVAKQGGEQLILQKM
ncbi:MAG: hypothetical protein V7L25_34325 [Nostoc sp.]|uniref:hypothetical protein n=1 Tax=Nostoc sp. TaxID=1180 RepID=UPI002FF0ADF3